MEPKQSRLFSQVLLFVKLEPFGRSAAQSLLTQVRHWICLNETRNSANRIPDIRPILDRTLIFWAPTRASDFGP